MKKIDIIKISKIPEIKLNNDLISADIISSNSSNILELNISDLNKLNKNSFDEFIKYWNLLWEIQSIDENIFIDFLSEVLNLKKDILISTDNSNTLFPTILIFISFFYIFFKKNIKKELKERYVLSRIRRKSSELFGEPKDEESIKLLKEYISGGYKSLKSFKNTLIEHGINPETFQYLYQCYSGLISNISKKIS